MAAQRWRLLSRLAAAHATSAVARGGEVGGGVALEVVTAVSELACLAVDVATSPLKGHVASPPGGPMRGLDLVGGAILPGSPPKLKHDERTSPSPELHARAKGRRRSGFGLLGCCRPSAKVEPDMWVVEPAPYRARQSGEGWRSADGATEAHGRPAAAA